MFRLVKSKAILKTSQCRTKKNQDSKDIVIGYKTMNVIVLISNSLSLDQHGKTSV